MCSLAGAVAISIAYGVRDISLSNDPLIELAEEGTRTLHVGTNLFLVDLFPALKHLPTWFPGAGFQRQAAIWREAVMKLVNMPFEQAEEAFVSFTFLCLQEIVNSCDLSCSEGWSRGGVILFEDHVGD